MSRERRGEQRHERGRRRRRGSRRANRPVDAVPETRRLSGTTLVVRGLIVLAVLAAVVGTTVVGLVTRGESRAVREDARPARQVDRTPKERATTPKIRGPVLPKSTPVAISIPTAHVQTRLVTLGLQTDGTVETPPVTHADRPGWYEASPTPGEAGPSVIIGYAVPVKGMPRPAFRDLGKVKRGATVEVARADKTIAVFRVERVARYPVTHFPADEVYGAVDHAALRLITYTPPTGSPDAGTKNVVVYASLRSSRAAG